MCYTVKYLTEKALRRAQRYGVQEDVDFFKKQLQDRFEEFYQVSGFAHPDLLIYTHKGPYQPILASWGLIPHWIKHDDEAKTIRNKTINARGESIFELPSFRDAARVHRCLIPIVGFYEYHYHKGKAYPFYIERSDQEPMTLAGLWSEWANPETGERTLTFSIVTTKGNSLLQKIHNNPRLKEARMPVILPETLADEWLQPINTELDKKHILELVKPYTQTPLHAHTVPKLTGKEAVGNVPEASEYYQYDGVEGVFNE